MTTVKIDHYSDILCIWAYVSQRRVDELLVQFGDQVEVDYHFFPVFGDAHGKIALNWQDRGGLKAYREHITGIAESYPHLHIHDQLWTQPTPTSSLPCHLYLCAARLLEEKHLIAPGSFRTFLKTLRQSFFSENSDISKHSVLQEIIEHASLPIPLLLETIEDGHAFAALAHDMQMAQKLAIQSSPTLIFNENRQRLTGNVGYKIIEANINELIAQPIGGQSWC